jgi:hypothetical protein
MATTRFNNNIVVTSRRLQDARATAAAIADTGRRYKSADLEDYQNRVIRDIIKERWVQVGVSFGDLFPELVKTSSLLTPAAGVIAKTTDMWRVLQLFNEDKTLFIDRIPDADVGDVIAGRSLIRPTVTTPVFYEERNTVSILPTTFAEDVYARYVISHPDIQVLVGAAGAGNFNTLDGSFTFATKTLIITMDSVFTVSDVNKPLIITDDNDANYFGHIASFVNATTVVLIGDGLPTADKPITTVKVADVSDVTDILLDKEWDGEIQDRMVKLAILDARENIMS